MHHNVSAENETFRVTDCSKGSPSGWEAATPSQNLTGHRGILSRKNGDLGTVCTVYRRVVVGESSEVLRGYRGAQKSSEIRKDGPENEDHNKTQAPVRHALTQYRQGDCQTHYLLTPVRYTQPHPLPQLRDLCETCPQRHSNSSNRHPLAFLIARLPSPLTWKRTHSHPSTCGSRLLVYPPPRCMT